MPVRWVFPTPGMKKTVEKEAQQVRHWAQRRAGSPGTRAQVMLQTVGVAPCLPPQATQDPSCGASERDPRFCLSVCKGRWQMSCVVRFVGGELYF